MTAARRRTRLPAILLSTLAIVALAAASLGSSPARAAACDPTVNPPADIDWSTQSWDTDQETAANFTSARAAEGCNTPMVLPAGYDAMTQQQQMLWLINSEREAMGEPDLQLDTTLMSQIALNHANEQATYGYFDHPSPINQAGLETGANLQRDIVNPVFNNWFFGENMGIGITPVAAVVFAYMYDDSTQGYGHRGAILQAAFTWIGIGINTSPNGPYYVDDFSDYSGFLPPGMTAPLYTPPATADTNPPTIASVSYAGGTATASGVADSPLNVNDTGPNPVTAAITGVVFYTNAIVENQAARTFNTVAATQTAPGSGVWTAPITVNPGDVLHAVAVDGSGNFVDVTPPPPAVPLTAGANTVALPAATTTPAVTPTMATDAALSASNAANPLAVTPSAAALATSIDRRAGRRIVEYVRVYANGHWLTYRPGRSASFALYANEGVVVKLNAAVRWRPPAGNERYAPLRVHLHRGWNFVAVPYPTTGMTCHAVRLELAKQGDRLSEISIGATPGTGVIMKAHHGSWAGDLGAHIPYSKGFWIDDEGSTTWTPTADGYRTLSLPATR